MYEIKSDQSQQTPLTAGIPPDLKRYAVDNADKCFHVSGNYGTQLFQLIEGDNFETWCIDFDIKDTVVLNSSAEKPALSLHLAVKNDFNYFLKGIGDVLLPAGRFNFTYAPQLEGRLKVTANQFYRYFDVHPVFTLLKDLTDCFPELIPFLDRVERGDTVMLKDTHPVATQEMQTVVHRILYNKFEGGLKKIYLEIKIYELVVLALHQSLHVKSSPNLIPLSDYETKKIRDAKDYLEKNIDNPLAISALARMVGMNGTKLKRGFKQQYDATIFDFVINLRMEKAVELLQQNNMAIQEIAFLTGYSNVANFTNAFKRKFGQPPTFFKRKR
jgi:AraC-like DNA-binding protein